MQKQFSIAEAKNRLPAIIHYVEKGPYVIPRKVTNCAFFGEQ
jgi:hypothetical protein